MSYKTNPIANRLKLNKGWKNSLFPTKRLNYSRDIVLWFKLYLFLKTYLALKRIQLLSCELRLSEINTRILYLSINKKGARKRRNNPKFLALKKIKSPLRRANSKKAKYWLYQQNLSWLKQISVWQHNVLHKKSLSKLWISKPRLFSWINLTAIIQKERRQFKLSQKILQHKKIFVAHNWHKIKFLGIKEQSIHKFKTNFWLLKQKKLLSIFSRIQKDVFFIQKKMIFLKAYKKSLSHRRSIPILLSHLSYELEKKQFIIAEVHKLYLFLSKQNCNNNLVIQSQVSSFKKKIIEYRIKHNFNIIWKIMQKQLKAFALKPLLARQMPKKFLHLYSLYFNTTLPYQFLMPTQAFFHKTILDWYFLSLSRLEGLQMKFNSFKMYKKNFSKRTLKSLLIANSKTSTSILFNQIDSSTPSFSQNMTLNKTKIIYTSKYFLQEKLRSKHCKIKLRVAKKILKSRIVPKALNLFYLLRYQHKVKLNIAIRKHEILYRSKKKVSLTNKFNYRIPYRQNYLQSLKVVTSYKLKFLIQDLIQQYFTLKIHVKILWPLNQFKNLRFYRLVFPNRKGFNRKKRNLLILKHDNARVFGKRYVYLSQMTTHLEKSQTKSKSFEENSTETRLLQLSVSKKQRKSLNKKTYVSAPTLWARKLLVRNKYLYGKWKKKQQSKQNVLSNFNRRPFIKHLVSSLVLFAKYLDPQILVEELAKIIKTTRMKKHRWLLNDIHTILKRLPLGIGLGYKIVLIGRIDGARKTRIISLAKFNRYRSQQTFSNHVNFAMTQTTARIGTFGIKVWIYY